ncbi:MAG: AI-2E family transporter [Prevotellaceae bacterium]|jgi:predicted PurR-regulated permease PerM|nr:AI-2E family transporter [Prevotellaceae bacterium]
MNKLARYIIIAVITAAVLFIVWYFQNIVAYVLAAVVLSFLGKPLVSALERIHYKKFRLPRALCAAIALVAIWGVFVLFFYFFIPLIIAQINEFGNVDVAQMGLAFEVPLQSIELFLKKYLVSDPEFSLKTSLLVEVERFFNVSHISDFFGSIIGTVKNVAVAAFAITFITFFFLKEEGIFSQFVALLFPERYENNILRALSSVNRLLIRYFVGIFTDMFCILTLVTLGITFIAGLPFKQAVLVGLVAGVLNVIPYVGPITGCTLGVVVGLVSTLNTGMPFAPLAIKMVCVFLAVQIIDAAFLQPYIYSNSIKAHPLEIFLVILIAGSLGGILGMLVAIPTYTVIRVFAKEFFNNFRVVQKLTENI